MRCDKGWKRGCRAFAGQEGPRPGEEVRGDQDRPEVAPRSLPKGNFAKNIELSQQRTLTEGGLEFKAANQSNQCIGFLN